MYYKYKIKIIISWNNYASITSDYYEVLRIRKSTIDQRDCYADANLKNVSFLTIL